VIEKHPVSPRCGARRLDTLNRNKWEASVDRRPVGRSASREGAFALAIKHAQQKDAADAR
jgi:hypothetical protein